MGISDSAHPLDRKGIGDALQAESAALRYRVVGPLLLDAGDATARVSHMLVDQFGILLIDVEEQVGSVRGKSGDKTWTLTAAAGARETFRNPLRQNDLNRQILHRVLHASGRNLPPQYVQSLVVFTGADTSSLELEEIDALRVIPAGEVLGFVRDRYSFPPNVGGLDKAEVADVVSFLVSVDRSKDPGTVARHADYIALAGKKETLWQKKRPHPSEATPSIATQVIFKGDDRYPDGSQVLPPPRRKSLLPMLTLVLLIAIAAWLVVGNGLTVLAGYVPALGPLASDARQLLSPTPPAVPQASPQAPPQAAPMSAPPVGADVPLALRRLREVDPRMYAALANRNSPDVSGGNGEWTYTWTYLKAVGGSVQVRKIAVALGPDGQIVDVSTRTGP
jgi:hypothetical protein